jgi:hypothetical protein
MIYHHIAILLILIRDCSRAQAGRGTNVGFIFYFGDTINSDQLQREDGRYLDDDAVEAFEYNTLIKIFLIIGII